MTSVYAKVSGLNTAADWQSWTADDLRPYIDHAISVFGAERLMFGSDWPVATLADDYQRVLDETIAAVRALEPRGRQAIFSGTANEFYNLGLSDTKES